MFCKHSWLFFNAFSKQFYRNIIKVLAYFFITKPTVISGFFAVYQMTDFLPCCKIQKQLSWNHMIQLVMVAFRIVTVHICVWYSASRRILNRNMWVLMMSFYDSENNVRVIYKDMTLYCSMSEICWARVQVTSLILKIICISKKKKRPRVELVRVLVYSWWWRGS